MTFGQYCYSMIQQAIVSLVVVVFFLEFIYKKERDYSASLSTSIFGIQSYNHCYLPIMNLNLSKNKEGIIIGIHPRWVSPPKSHHPFSLNPSIRNFVF